MEERAHAVPNMTSARPNGFPYRNTLLLWFEVKESDGLRLLGKAQITLAEQEAECQVTDVVIVWMHERSVA